MKLKRIRVISIGAAMLTAVIASSWWILNDTEPVPNAGLQNSAPSRNLEPTLKNEISEREPDHGIAEDGRFKGILDRLYLTAKRDSRAAFQAIDSVIPERYRSKLRVALAEMLVRDDFSRVHEVLEFLPDPSECENVLARTVPSAAEAKLSETLVTINQKLTGESKNAALRFVVLSQLKGGSLSGAVKTQLSMPFSNSREQAIVQIAHRIGATGVDFALDWIQKLQAEGEQPKAFSMLQDYFLEKRDFAALERILPMTTDPPARKALIHAIASQYAQVDNSSAQAFADSLPPEDREFLSIAKKLNSTSSSIPEKLDFALTLPSPSARSNAISGIIGNAVSKNPAEVANLIMSMPEKSRLEIVPALVQQWVAIDSEAVSLWVQELPKGSLRDKAISTLSLRLRFTDRSAAREVAKWVDDPIIRDRLLQRVGQ